MPYTCIKLLFHKESDLICINTMDETTGEEKNHKSMAMLFNKLNLP